MTSRLDDTRGGDRRCSVKRATTTTEQVLSKCVLLRGGGGGGGVNVGLQVVQGNFESEGHEKGTREHAQEDGQRVGLLPALHTAKQR